MFLVVQARDKPGHLETRLANREAHLAFAKNGPAHLHVAGPLLDADGQMCGSLLIFETDDGAGFRDWIRDDPYAVAGLFETVDIQPFKWAIGAPEPATGAS